MNGSTVWWVLVLAAAACDSGSQPAAKPDPWGSTPPATPPTAPSDPWGAKPSAPASPAPATPSTSPTPTPRDANSPVGFWYGISFEPGSHYSINTNSWSYETQTKIVYALFLPDGRMIDGSPYAGLADFDYATWARDVVSNASLGGIAGTYTWSGSSGEVTLSTTFKKPIALVDGELALGKAKLKRVPSVDGVKLDGTYTWFSNPKDPYLDGPGCKPMITLRADGTFEDRGAFVLTCPPASTEPNLPGNGTYTIRDYSLILSYAGGRAASYRITPVLNNELRPDSPTLFLQSRIAYRR